MDADLVDDADQYDHDLDHHGAVGQFYKTNTTTPICVIGTSTGTCTSRAQDR